MFARVANAATLSALHVQLFSRCSAPVQDAQGPYLEVHEHGFPEKYVLVRTGVAHTDILLGGATHWFQREAGRSHHQLLLPPAIHDECDSVGHHICRLFLLLACATAAN